MDRKVFHFDSPAENYVADAAVVCCFDERIRIAVNEFLRKSGILHPDMIVLAGGAKTLASPESGFERDFVLEQIRLSVRLHGTNRAILMNHSDCGAYGGFAAFRRERQVEMQRHSEELARASAMVRKTFCDLSVETYFVAFDGVFSTETK